ncbi:uncharacterized protein MELLADRAFT_38934 [Melampsora larici-populina 98AG31]|uniref:Protein kinase domain-containing protein n=1 Tax=Melampsora larici-populina (strain 98AG31 / pathotype 3-4-7) TaxID=747676 RepID=F4S0H9_MELLP|nr:uncharacterized protein MELLADRAFT_38934 [Melampsora larici-populina 98AG31]EGG01867.1 hypothetical protein MELLADRAFT_38934 [Melampsora larici-populina 98AG31]
MSSKTIIVETAEKSQPNKLSSSDPNHPPSEDTTSSHEDISLGEFQLFETLGFGASGSVCRAKCNSDQRVYAIKKIPQYSFQGTNQESVIMNEIDLLKEARHPGITEYFGCYLKDVIFHLVLELVDGGTLREKLDKKVFSEDEARVYALNIAKALEYLHGKHIIHRDVKLANVLLTSDDQIKLADFGLAIKVTSGSASGYCGTKYAQAPEMIRRENYTKSIDWWAFGVMMFEMVTGEKPFKKRMSPFPRSLIICLFGSSTMLIFFFVFGSW